MNIAFTIVAKNYIGLAKILKTSFLRHNPKADFFIFVADEYEGQKDGIIEAKGTLRISEEKWLEMSFKYDITEFCTSIKPFCFDFLFQEKGYEKVIYLDPDIYLFGSFDEIFKKLSEKSFYLIPHLLIPDDDYDGERVYLQAGIYNLGFIGMSSSENSLRFTKWWEHKLYDNCFDDLISYTFTDQKWANYIPSFFPNDVYISNDLGMNVAPWNFYERSFELEGERVFVKARKSSVDRVPLVFVHYSGFDYKGLINGKVERKRRGGYDKYDDLHIILDVYEKTLKDSSGLFLKYIDLPYSYGTYTNGTKIDKFHRRVYRKFVQNNNNIGNPFDANNPSFYSIVEKLGMITTEAVNRMDVDDVKQINGKLKVICTAMKMVYKIVGYKRYLQLLKFLKYFSRSESQAFLINKEMSKYILSV